MPAPLESGALSVAVAPAVESTPSIEIPPKEALKTAISFSADVFSAKAKLLKAKPPADLTPKEKGIVTSYEGFSKTQTQVNPDTMTRTLNIDGKDVQEGLPVTSLIDHLNTRIDSGELSDEDKLIYEQNRDTILAHSKKYSEVYGPVSDARLDIEGKKFATDEDREDFRDTLENQLILVMPEEESVEAPVHKSTADILDRAIQSAITSPKEARLMLQILVDTVSEDIIETRFSKILSDMETSGLPKKNIEETRKYVDQLRFQAHKIHAGIAGRIEALIDAKKEGKTPELRAMGYDIKKHTLIMNRANDEDRISTLENQRASSTASGVVDIDKKIEDIRKGMTTMDSEIEEINKVRTSITKDGTPTGEVIPDQVEGFVGNLVKGKSLTPEEQKALADNPLAFAQKHISEAIMNDDSRKDLLDTFEAQHIITTKQERMQLEKALSILNKAPNEKGKKALAAGLGLVLMFFVLMQAAQGKES
jgi:hypothetical protein